MKTEINIIALLFILLIHWIADFVAQTDKQAQGKSKDNLILMEHTGIYSIIWLVPAILMLGISHGIWFCLITFVAHTITDYFTSRVNSRLWTEKKVHEFFVSIGFDQWLHYAQLFITYCALSQ